MAVGDIPGLSLSTVPKKIKTKKPPRMDLAGLDKETDERDDMSLAKLKEVIGYAVDQPVVQTTYPRGAKRASVKLRTGKRVSKTTTGHTQ